MSASKNSPPPVEHCAVPEVFDDAIASVSHLNSIGDKRISVASKRATTVKVILILFPVWQKSAFRNEILTITFTKAIPIEHNICTPADGSSLIA